MRLIRDDVVFIQVSRALVALSVQSMSSSLYLPILQSYSIEVYQNKDTRTDLRSVQPNILHHLISSYSALDHVVYRYRL